MISMSAILASKGTQLCLRRKPQTSHIIDVSGQEQPDVSVLIPDVSVLMPDVTPGINLVFILGRCANFSMSSFSVRQAVVLNCSSWITFVQF